MSRSELDVSLEGLRVFVAVAEQGSIAGSSSWLGTSRATVRRQIDQLEETLGFRLVVRNREGIELTDEGHRFLLEARKLLGLARETILKARELRPEPQRRVRVAVQVGYPVPFALMLHLSTIQRFPDTVVEFLVSERPSEQLPDKADIAMCLGEQSPKVPCVKFELLSLRQRLLGAPSFIAANGPFEDPEETSAHVIGSWRGPDGDHSVLHLARGGHLNISPKTISSDETYLRAVGSSGHGLIYAPLPLNSALDPAEPMVAVLDQHIGRAVPSTLYALEAIANLSLVRFVVDTCRSMFQRYDES